MTAEPALCPSCGRFIGPVLVCPYCDADARRAPELRVLRGLALMLAIAGVGILVLAGRQRELPRISVGSVTPAMNFARVRVSGTVRGEPWVRWEGDRVAYASFWIRDGSAELRVTVQPGAGEPGAEADALPGRGERVDVTGVLRISADGQKQLRARSLARRGEGS